MDSNLLIQKLAVRYSDVDQNNTKLKRQHNINILTDFIKNEIDKNSLKNKYREERLLYYVTSNNEKIYIQFPGKESIRDDNKFDYDMRPELFDSRGIQVPSMAFRDMWDVMDYVNTQAKMIMDCISLIIFRMGKMLNHKLEEHTYEVLYSYSDKVDTAKLTLYRLDIEPEIFEFLNFKIEDIKIGDAIISFEAFLYFFDLILQNEDNKYFFKKNNLNSGREKTSEAMLLLSSYYDDKISLPVLLQKYVTGMGIGTMTKDEIINATNGNILYYNVKDLIKEKLNNLRVEYKENSSKSIAGKTISLAIKLEEYKIGMLKNGVKINEINTIFKENGWNLFEYENMEIKFDEIVKIIDDYKNQHH